MSVPFRPPRLALLAVLVVLPGLLAAADPTPPQVIRLPEPAVPSVPPPPPQPVTTGYVLNADELFVVDSSVELFPRAYPAGVLTWTAEAGPLSVHSKFVGGGGKTETKKFKGPFVYLVRGARTAAADLVLIPKGVQADDQIVTTLIQSNVGPRPPPDPIDPPPDPVPVSTNPFGDLPGLRVLMVYESSAPLPLGQGPVLTGKAVRDYLETHCAVGADGKTREYRIWDKDVTGV